VSEAPAERINPRTGTALHGHNRPGATDTTYLIWRVIADNPGISAEDLFARVESRIPSGWAFRRWINNRAKNGVRMGSTGPVEPIQPSGSNIAAARREVLSQTLAGMTHRGVLRREGEPGTGKRSSRYTYTVLRPLRKYYGNPDHVDLPGSTRAADHLNAAYGLRTLQEFLKRTEGVPRWAMTNREREAVRAVLKAHQDGELLLPLSQPREDT
jgi:hypothetical protein